MTGGRSRDGATPAGVLGPRRVLAGSVLAVVAGALLTWLLVTVRSDDALTASVLSYQLLVVVVALVGGIRPALATAVLSGLLLDYLFVQPLQTLKVSQPSHLIALVLSVVIAVLVSLVVDRAARQARVARRAAAESDLLTAVAGSVLRGQDALQAMVSRIREDFGPGGVRLVRDGTVLAVDGTPADDPVEYAVGDRAVLQVTGPPVADAERRVLAVILEQLAAALEHGDLAATAGELEPLAAADRVRSALLSALSHDLRRPLAAATAAVGGLRLTTLADEDRAELLDTADQSLAALAGLLTDLLDVSRVQAGVLAVSAVPLDPADVVVPALDELGVGPDEVALDLATDLPEALADPVLLQRVLVNLLANALRHSPDGTRVSVTTGSVQDEVEIRVVDRGPGIPPDRHDDVFLPFQRLDDLDNSAGLGLGLALSRGFVEGMSGTLLPEQTPGGGLTMVVRLPVVRPEEVVS